MDVAVTATGLGKRYGRVWALRDCTVDLPAGSIVAVVGANGAGKTTFLRAITGLLSPSQGEVWVLGQPAGLDTPASLARVAFVAQERPLYRRLSVADHLDFGSHLNPRFDVRLAAAQLQRVGVPMHRRVSDLSGGQQAQVALALAIAKRPDILVLDEPWRRSIPWLGWSSCRH